MNTHLPGAYPSLVRRTACEGVALTVSGDNTHHQTFFLRLLKQILVFLLFPTAAFAWTEGLQQAAQAVAFGQATPAQEMMVFLNNREINLLAQEGKLTDLVYASCQDQFFRLNEKFVHQAVAGTDLKVSISDAKLNPGTDTDVNVSTSSGKKLTLEDIQTVEGKYDAAVRRHFADQKLDVPKSRIDTNTDFMPHPDHTTQAEFEKIANHINNNHGTAYTDPKAASAQSKLGTGQNIGLDEASSFSSTMKDMANTKVNGAKSLRDQARTVRASDPAKAEMLEAQAAQYEYQAAKYHERLTKLDQQLRKQYGLPEKSGTSAMDDAAEKIARIGRNPYSARDAATVRNLHQNALQSSTDDLIDTMLKIAKKNPSRLAEIRQLVAREASTLPMNRAAQAMTRLDSTVKQIGSAAKWATFKDSVKNLSGIKQMTKLSVVMTAGGALLMGHEGVQVALNNVKATDTLWDFFKSCYQHAAWEGTGIGPAFDRAQAEELERYMKEFEDGTNPSMAKHVTFTILKSGVYLGQDVLIGVLYLPDTIWEYFTQEKEMEAYAAMQNDLAKVMHQMVLDRQAYDKMMTQMRKLGLHDEDVKPFLDCLCRNCGGSLGGLYNPGFKGEYGRGPCQCNGPLTIWKTPLPTQDKKTQYACFNQITKMRYDEAQDIFNKWHQQALTENANAVQEDMKAIKDAITSRKMQEDEETARHISDQFNAIKDLLRPEDVDYVRAMVGPYLANYAARNVEAGNIPRALDNLDRVLNKIGTRHPQEEANHQAARRQYEQWGKTWQETESKHFPSIHTLVQKNQVQRAGAEIESLEYRMLKEFPRVLPPAVKDPDFVALKDQVQNLQKSYASALREAWQKSSELQKSRDPRGAIPVLQHVVAHWEHRTDTLRDLNGQIAYDQSEVAKADALKKRGMQSEEQGALAQAIELYAASLAIQRDEGLEHKIQGLKSELVKQQTRMAQAKQLRDQGQLLQQQGRIPEAISKYRESLKLMPDPKLEQHIQTLEHQLQAEQQKKALAQQLRTEGEVFQRQNQLANAVAKYRESLRLVPDLNLERHIQTLESQLQAQQHRIEQAKRLRAEGEVLQRQNHIREAIGKYRESLALVPDPALQAHIEALERSLQKPATPPTPVPASPGGRSYTSIEPAHPIPVLPPKVDPAGTGPQPPAPTSQPKTDYCKNYTALAVTRQHENVQRGCGFTGNRWHTSESGHYNWCMGVSLDLSASETQGRDQDLQGCNKPAAIPTTRPKVLYDNGNISGVYNLPTRPTTFNLSRPATITSIVNYHWNNARGSSRTGTISLRDTSGHVYGPWPTTGTPGQGGVPNAYWTARPNLQIPAGNYTVVDSDPASWAQNSGSSGAGHTRIEGY
ncbi:hypothetical protein [Rhodoferax sp.]|uniref:hypothetical protein n=1 Tax=Rhodoferax sp. TaxID=50421 RepID=UPI0026083636|nr:hypothetical protein [Rhodoferax sp.]MDD2926089.1 hypothetical protein [Rhodoferax sp.]